MAQDLFEFEIVRPLESHTMVVEWIEVSSITGSFVVGPQHSPLIAVLKSPGVITYKLAGEPAKTMTVYGGMLHVTSERATAVLES